MNTDRVCTACAHVVLGPLRNCLMQGCVCDCNAVVGAHRVSIPTTFAPMQSTVIIRDMVDEKQVKQGRRIRSEWQTPRALHPYIIAKWAIDLDVCARAYSAIVRHYIGPPDEPEPGPDVFLFDEYRRSDRVLVARDALATPWPFLGVYASAFCNPPFSNIRPFVDMAIDASQGGMATTFLLPATRDPKWYAALVDAGGVVFDPRGRIAYEPPPGVDASTPPSPSMFVHLAAYAERRKPGAAVPTFVVDPRTLATL